MPKADRDLKFQRTPESGIGRSSVRGGSMDHGAMTGRGDNDHPQYLLLSTLFPSVRVANSGDQTIPNNNAATVLTFDTELWDTAGFHSTTTNTSRLTVPPGYDGTYIIGGVAQFEAHATGQRIYSICYNGDLNNPIHQVQHTNNTGANRMALPMITPYQLNVDDYVQFRIYQNRGGDLDIRAINYWSPIFWMIRIGPK